jgi:hypothetical protein
MQSAQEHRQHEETARKTIRLQEAKLRTATDYLTRLYRHQDAAQPGQRLAWLPAIEAARKDLEAARAALAESYADQPPAHTESRLRQALRIALLALTAAFLQLTQFTSLSRLLKLVREPMPSAQTILQPPPQPATVMARAPILCERSATPRPAGIYPPASGNRSAQQRSKGTLGPKAAELFARMKHTPPPSQAPDEPRPS